MKESGGVEVSPDNFRVNLLLVIAALIFIIFAAGKAAPSPTGPQLIVTPP